MIAPGVSAAVTSVQILVCHLVSYILRFEAACCVIFVNGNFVDHNNPIESQLECSQSFLLSHLIDVFLMFVFKTLSFKKYPVKSRSLAPHSPIISSNLSCFGLVIFTKINIKSFFFQLVLLLIYWTAKLVEPQLF